MTDRPLTKQEMNQCDGCRRGLPIRNGNIHYDLNTGGNAVMSCTADRYTSKKTDTPGNDPLAGSAERVRTAITGSAGQPEAAGPRVGAGGVQSSNRNTMGEMEDPVALAERVLDRPFADPDDELSILARQFQRHREYAEAWHRLVESIAVILEVNPNGSREEVGNAISGAIQRLKSPDETKKDGPGNRSVTLNGYQLKAALQFLAPDNDPDQLESEVSIQWGEAGHSGANYYCCMAEYPEEGSIALNDNSPCVVETVGEELSRKSVEHFEAQKSAEKASVRHLPTCNLNYIDGIGEGCDCGAENGRTDGHG